MKINNKQQLLLEYLISSPDTFAICKSIVKPEYFDPEYRQVVSFVHEYYDKYSTTPNSAQILGETDVVIKQQPITPDQINYCSDQIEQFCRRKAIKLAVIAASSLIESDDTGKIETLIRDAIAVSLNRDLGLDYFADPLARLEKMTQEPQRIPTKMKGIDDLLGGGLARKEMLLLSANSGGGKSIVLANLALNYLMQGLNVMYVSLELSEEMIAQRFDTMFTEIPTVNWLQHYEEIASDIKFISDQMVTNHEGQQVPAGNLNIKRMPSGTNSNKIRSYLKEFYLKNGYMPDVLVVDYLDIMGANEKVSADNISEKDKLAAEQLRDIGFEINAIVCTASQQNRSAIDAQELNQSHIAGGLTKVNTVDWYISIILTPALKAQGEIGFAFLKSRSSDAVGKTVWMKWDNKALRVRNMGKEDIEDDPIVKAVASTNKRAAVGMNDLFNYTG